MLTLTFVSAACAALVVVKPSNMNGWIADAYQGQDPDSTPPVWSFSNNTAPPHLDAFFMSMGYSVIGGGPNEEATNELWFGTNQFVGTRISDITKLQYSTFTEFSGNLWESHTSCPIKLIITIKTDGVPDNYPPEERTADGPRNWLLLMFNPWDVGNGPGLHTWDRSQYGCWQTWDLMTSVFYVGMEPDDNNWQSWSEIVTNYPNATIEYPYTYAQNLAASGFYDPWKAPYPAESRYNAANLTGTSLSFQAGARRTNDDDFGGAWWKEHIGMRGYVDMLTVGVNGADTTFDFQADAPPSDFYATSNRGAVCPVMNQADNMYHFVVFGKVLSEQYMPFVGELLVDDGSGIPIKVKAPSYLAQVGDYIRAAGVLSHDELEADDTSVTPVTSKVQPTLFSDEFNVTVIKAADPF